MSNQRTGRGVAAIISPGERTGNYREIPLDQIIPNQNQPRKDFEKTALVALADSIKAVGILQPVLVREIQQGSYELIAGERRYRAAQEVGLKVIPAIIRSVKEQDSLEQALAENLQRVELNPLEEAAAYRSLIDDFGLSQQEVATRVQKSRATIANTIRLMSLPATIQKLITDESLSAGHARAILSLKSAQEQTRIANKVVKEGWSVRKLEEFAKDTNPTKSVTLKSASLLELENLLSEYLNTRVAIQLGAKDKGKVTVQFFGLEDLERIFNKMQGN